jgi:hypothetical protein
MLNLPKRSKYAKHKPLYILAGIVIEVGILAVLVVLAILVFGSIYIRVVEDPKFCGSLCHEMKPSYTSYKNSSHTGILCSECHSEPGTKGFFKGVIVDAANEIYIHMSGEEFYDMDELHPPISDASCLRHECHKVSNLAENKTLFKDDGIFSHRAHLSEAPAHADGGSPMTAEMMGTSPPLNCISCHSRSVERHMAVDEQTCFLCHFSSKSEMDCSSCHAIPAAQHEAVMGDASSCNACHAIALAEVSVPSESCAHCHEVMGHTLDAESAHKLHVEPQHARCMECHQPLKEEHGKLFAHYDENCQKCHSAQDGMYQGTVELVVEVMPSIKAESVDCSSCHTSTVENGVGSLDEIKQMCVECHEAGYDETLDGWQEMIRDEITEAESLLSDVAALLKKSEDKPQKQQASSLYEEAKKRVLFVQKDGSSGAHNLELADKLMTDAIDSLKRCQQLLK